MAIYVCGDTHGYYDITKLTTKAWPQQKELTKNDYLIILGDFGLIWQHDGESNEEKYWLNWLNNKPFTTLFIDGNHENFTRLSNYSIEYWNGGKVQKIRNSIIHLMRGQYYTIDRATVWTMGGANSHDIQDGVLDLAVPENYQKLKAWSSDPNKLFRIKNIDWWPQEMPSAEEFAEGLKNLSEHENKVDFVFTHDCPASTFSLMYRCANDDKFRNYLQQVREKITFNKWYFGHHHIDLAINNTDIACYRKVIRIW